MKKRISLLLSVALVITSLSCPVFASTTEQTEEVVSVNTEENSDIEEVSVEEGLEAIEETEGVVADEVVADESVNDESVIEDAPEVAEDEIALEDEAVTEESEAVIADAEEISGAVSVSGNVALKFKSLVDEFYCSSTQFDNEPVKIAEAEFEVAAGSAIPALSANTIYVRRNNEVEYYKPANNKMYGFEFGVAEGKYLTMQEYYKPYPGTYYIKVSPEGHEDVYAEYAFTVKPDFQEVYVYVNKYQGYEQKIYTDGKKQLALSLSAKTWAWGEKNSKSVSPTYEMVKEGTVTQCVLNGNKVSIPKNFSGTEIFTIKATTKNRNGADVYGVQRVIVTNVPEEAKAISILKLAWERDPDTGYNRQVYTEIAASNADKKVSVSADSIDDKYIQVKDKDGNVIDAKLKANGKSLKLIKTNKGYRIEATGLAGITEIVATTVNGKKTEKFSVDVSAFDNANLQIYAGNYLSVSQNEVLAESYNNAGQNIKLYVGSTGYSDSAVSAKVGNYKLTVTGGKITNLSSKSSPSKEYMLMPTSKTTVLILKKGSDVKTYTITNAAYDDSLKTIKNASVKMYYYYCGTNSVTVQLKGDYAGTTSFIIADEITQMAKYLKKDSYAYSNARYMIQSNTVSSDGKLTINLGSWCTAGKYTVMAYPVNNLYQPTAKPVKLTLNITKSIPKPSLTIKAKKYTIKKAVGESADIELKNYKNIKSINFVELQNDYVKVNNKKVLNSFTSYYKVSDFSVTTDANGKISMKAKLKVKDSEPEPTDNKGKLRIGVTKVNGDSAIIYIPISAALKSE